VSFPTPMMPRERERKTKRERGRQRERERKKERQREREVDRERERKKKKERARKVVLPTPMVHKKEALSIGVLGFRILGLGVYVSGCGV